MHFNNYLPSLRQAQGKQLRVNGLLIRQVGNWLRQEAQNQLP